MRAVVAACKVSSLLHSICSPLCVPEVWSHDANVTIAMEVDGRVSKTDFQLKHKRS